MTDSVFIVILCSRTALLPLSKSRMIFVPHTGLSHRGRRREDHVAAPAGSFEDGYMNARTAMPS